ncbi:hypothetical protein SDC9_98531 [bioreactor metagenome]|uniref:Uncharacterized protein n=1 Tax=bioreactor metagenome TaxID=1076179 RepID=A0A645AF42_9ZZZZ
MENPAFSQPAPPAPAVPPDAGPRAPDADETVRVRSELEQLKTKLSEFEKQQLPEAERVRRELSELTAQRDAAAEELKRRKRDDAVKALAAGQRFNDPEYLDFLLARRNIDPGDADRTEPFLREFRATNPRFFNVELKSGSGSRPDVRANHPLASGGGASAIAAMLADAPEIL